MPEPELTLRTTITTTGSLPDPVSFLVGLRTGIRNWLNVARRAMRAAAPRGSGPYPNQPGRRPGRLAASIRTSVRTRGDLVIGRIGPRVFYARMVEGGTRPHQIRPRLNLISGRRYLFFMVGDRPVLVQTVKHPGAPPRPFVEPTAQAKRGELPREIEAALSQHVVEIRVS